MRAAAAAALIGVAAALHLTFCEWRTLEIAPEDAAAEESRVLVRFARSLHADGNAAEWDAYQLKLRAYHRDWVECWQARPEARACADVPLRTKDATVWAVALRQCELERELAISGTLGFRACLAGRGRFRAPAPRWTSQHIGHRSEAPHVRLSALFAEPRTGSAWSDRALGWRMGLLAPATLCLLAAWLLSGLRPRRGGAAASS